MLSRAPISFHRAPRRPVSLLLVAIASLLSACSSAPRPPQDPPASLETINAALIGHLADVTLTDGVVMRRLQGVSISLEKLSWTTERRQIREMPIAEVVRIVALSTREKARVFDADGGFEGSVDGATGAAVGVALATVGLAAERNRTEETGVVVYEAPISRYLDPAEKPVDATGRETEDREPPTPR